MSTNTVPTKSKRLAQRKAGAGWNQHVNKWTKCTAKQGHAPGEVRARERGALVGKQDPTRKYRIRVTTAPLRPEARLEVTRREARNMRRWRDRHPFAGSGGERESESNNDVQTQ